MNKFYLQKGIFYTVIKGSLKRRFILCKPPMLSYVRFSFDESLKNFFMNYKEICNKTCVLVAEVAEFIQQKLGKVSTGDIETKALNSLVSYVDKTAEEKIG